jgi:hypothetical protein
MWEKLGTKLPSKTHSDNADERGSAFCMVVYSLLTQISGNLSNSLKRALDLKHQNYLMDNTLSCNVSAINGRFPNRQWCH